MNSCGITCREREPQTPFDEPGHQGTRAPGQMKSAPPFSGAARTLLLVAAKNPHALLDVA